MTDRLLLKRRIGRMAKFLVAGPSRRLVLLYHSAGDSPWAVPLHAFRQQMEYLAASARMLPLDALATSDAGERIQVAITFDDGYATLHDAVHPLARDLGIRPAVFVNTGWISDGERRPARAGLGHYEGEAFMTWREVHRLAEAGWQIGSHGVEHLDLSRASPERAKSELELSKAAIEARLSLPCQTFAYPWGRQSAALRTLLRDAGYIRAYGTLHAPLGAHDDPWHLPRMDVRAAYTLDDLKAVVNGDWDYLGWIQGTRKLIRSLAPV